MDGSSLSSLKSSLQILSSSISLLQGKNNRLSEAFKGDQRSTTSAGWLTAIRKGMASLGEDLLGTVNKLQDLVFNTIGNDSLDLPQIVSRGMLLPSLQSFG